MKTAFFKYSKLNINVNICIKNIKKQAKFFSEKSSSKKPYKNEYIENLNNLSDPNIEHSSIIPINQKINPALKKEIKNNLEGFKDLQTETEKELFYNKLDATNYMKHLTSDFD